MSAGSAIVTQIDGNDVTLDAPLNLGLDATLGVSKVHVTTWPGRIAQVGVENLRCESQFRQEQPRDEDHAWMAITLEAVQNAWVRQVKCGPLRQLGGQRLGKLQVRNR